MLKKWIGAGWKMNKTRAEARRYVLALLAYLENTHSTANMFIVPPYTVLFQMCEWLKQTRIMIGAQNMHWENQGALTGEISPVMIKDCGASLVEIGHSERRLEFGETNEMINLKVHAALAHGLRPLICVGETAYQKRVGAAGEAVVIQVKMALHRVLQEDIPKAILVYEPAWAIGDSGKPASPEYANEIHALIRKTIANRFGEDIAQGMPILYGGSVRPGDARALIERPEIDGLFVGRAAWQVEGLIELIKMVEETGPGKTE